MSAPAELNKGYTYKVITNYTNKGTEDKCPTCKIGDMIISNGSAWVVIPSGDEPSGTVTSITAGTGLTATGEKVTNGTITSSGTISINRSTVDT